MHSDLLHQSQSFAAVMSRVNTFACLHLCAHRLINSEGDRLSGVIVDVLGEVAVSGLTHTLHYTLQICVLSSLEEHFTFSVVLSTHWKTFHIE